MTFLNQFPSTTRRSFLKGAGMVSAAAVTGSFPIPAIAQAQEVTMISAENNGASLDAMK
ncbi:twin-arginine translocation signal domain-containing protein, partial [Rhizobium johnstonii]|uniref:twin-arginine translocation signal domain-containing protein n=1 Tax=Rhizobium johnstonii TaxID=3019933 RepID=UPI003F95476D